jgi:hypothetical protein
MLNLSKAPHKAKKLPGGRKVPTSCGRINKKLTRWDVLMIILTAISTLAGIVSAIKSSS